MGFKKTWKFQQCGFSSTHAPVDVKNRTIRTSVAQDLITKTALLDCQRTEAVSTSECIFSGRPSLEAKAAECTRCCSRTLI